MTLRRTVGFGRRARVCGHSGVHQESRTHIANNRMCCVHENISQRGVKVSQRVPTEAAGRITRLRDSLISPGLRIHFPGLQIHAHTACRVPLPLSPISDR